MCDRCISDETAVLYTRQVQCLTTRKGTTMLKTACSFALLLAALFVFTGCEIFPHTSAKPLAADADDDGFVSIFNGKDLTGWTPKIRYEELGEDKRNSFRVADGMIQVRYDKYDAFNETFGHLFYDTPYSSYILRLEYRFVGEQVKGGPGWAFMNSGVMFHGQDPKDMKKDQDFPDSIEAQLLGQKVGVEHKRPTANVCSPGTHYVKDGKLVRAHCQSSSSKTFHGDQWVTFEYEVHGHGKIIHRVNGDVAFEYEQAQLDDGTKLSGGTISLQSESHPIDFRNIEIKVLKK